MELINSDLYKAKYDIKTLEENMDSYNLNIKTLLRTQHLTPDFCVKYIIFNDEYAWYNEETYIADGDVVYYQPHITMEQLRQAWVKLEEENPEKEKKPILQNNILNPHIPTP